MTTEFRIKEGIKFSRKFTTTSYDSAKHLGTGDVEVLSTPSMIKYMEEACRVFVEEFLPNGYTTVGILVNVKHIAPAPVGSEIEVRGILLSVNGRRLTFWVEAFWKGRKIGYGLHERAIVNKREFIEKLKSSL